MPNADHKTSQKDDTAISASQQRAIEVLLAGGTDAEAAKAGSVSRETVCRWRHADADFIAALNRERRAAFEATRDNLRRASLKAIETLAGLLSDKSRPLRLKAAAVLLHAMGEHGADLAGGETNPEDIRADWDGAKNRRGLRALGGF